MDSKDLDTKIDNLNDAARSARATWLGLISVSLFLATTLLSVTHLDFLLERPLRLPLVGTSVSMNIFFAISPLIVLTFHAWSTMAHRILSDRIATFESSPGFKRPSRARLSPYLVAQSMAGPGYGPVSTVVLNSARWGAIHGIPICLLLYFQASFLPNHSTEMLWWHRCLIVLALMVFLFVDRPVLQDARRKAIHGIKAAIALLTLAVSLVVFSGYDEPFRPDVPGLISDEVDLVARGPHAQFSRVLILPLYDLSAERPAGTRLSLQSKDLRGGVFVGSNFSFADATGAKFQHADLRRTSFNVAKVQAANFLGADLYGATMIALDAIGANFAVANLTDVEASGANFSRASFAGANLQNILLDNGRLGNADLGAADLRGAFLMNTEPPGWAFSADRYFGTDLSGIQIRPGYVRNSLVEDLSEEARKYRPSTRLLFLARLARARTDEETCMDCNSTWLELARKTGAQARLDYTRSILRLACATQNRDMELHEGVVLHRMRPAEWETQADNNRANQSRQSPNFDQTNVADALYHAKDQCHERESWSDLALWTLKAILEPGRSSFLETIDWIDLTENNDLADRVSASGNRVALPGEVTLVYGARAQGCGEAPTFVEAMEAIVSTPGFEFDPAWGTLLDGGISRRKSNSCRGDVATRAVAYRPRAGFSGSFKLVLHGSDVVTVTVPEN